MQYVHPEVRKDGSRDEFYRRPYMPWIAQLVRALARKAKGWVQVPVQDRISL